jgi:hypothetical protein
MALDRQSAEHGHPLAIAVKTPVRPVGHQVIGSAQPLIDDSRRVRCPVPPAVVPELGHFLQADQVDVEFVDRPRDQRQFFVLPIFLTAMQVEDHHRQGSPPNDVVLTEVVVRERLLPRFARNPVLNAKSVVYRQFRLPDLAAVVIGVSRVAAKLALPVVALW